MTLGLLAAGGEARAQAPAKPANPAAVPGAGEVVATVNGDKITKGDLLTFLTRYPIPAMENREQIYRDAVDSLVNTRLLAQFLGRQNIKVPDQRVNEEISRLEQQLKAEGQDLSSALLANGISLDDIRKEMLTRIRWNEYAKAKATDAELKKFLAAHKDLFGGTQVRASHILIKVDPNASAAEKEKARQKLLGIKKDIESGKISFAEAANKYSDDPSNAGGGGGDLDYFTLGSGFIEEFTDVAFKLKKGEISDPVETPYGWHLIYVTDRKEGKLPEFEQAKPQIANAYFGEIQKNLLTAERKKAKIEVKPMPKDLFPAPAPAATPGQTKTKNSAPAPATPKQ
jgi:parvulin-like peptidyl-prolyl isomerase